jgi:hypothetical protein
MDAVVAGRLPHMIRPFARERVTGIEPASPAWKAGALAIELHPRTGWNGTRVDVRTHSYDAACPYRAMNVTSMRVELTLRE